MYKIFSRSFFPSSIGGLEGAIITPSDEGDSYYVNKLKTLKIEDYDLKKEAIERIFQRTPQEIKTFFIKNNIVISEDVLGDEIYILISSDPSIPRRIK